MEVQARIFRRYKREKNGGTSEVATRSERRKFGTHLGLFVANSLCFVHIVDMIHVLNGYVAHERGQKQLHVYSD